MPEFEAVGGLNRLFCGDTLACNQADELAQEHLAVLAGEAHGRLAIAPILDTFDERVGLHLDLHVLHDQRPERVMLSTQTKQPIRLAAVHPEVIEVLGDTFVGPGADHATRGLYGALSELIDNGVVVAKLDTPDRFLGVVGCVAVTKRIAVVGGPDGVPVIELVGRAGL
ncbi:hypothetical protein G6F24_012472 [Rhizopus arrhizus]|nr:hypothetical protein G6F24_012472 [Rhizopus arrhizus]